jgi:hypothetical protein
MLERKDIDIFVSAGDELCYGLEFATSRILIPLINRGIYAENLRLHDRNAEKRIAEYGFDPIHEPQLLGKWKFIYNAILDHSRKWNKELRCWESCSVERAIFWSYRDKLSRGSRDDVAVKEAREKCEAQWLYFDSSVEEVIGIPATYRYTDSTKTDHEVIGFYELVDEICDAGIARLVEFLPADWAKDKIDTYKELKEECNA